MLARFVVLVLARKEDMTIPDLYADEFDKLVAHARRFGSPDAEATVQDAAVAVTRAAGTADNLKGLLYKTVEHKAIDAYRKERAKLEYEVPAGGIAELAYLEDEQDGSAAPLASDKPEHVRFRQQFNRALRALPEEERDAFILLHLRGLTRREAGAVLRQSRMTVHRRAERARLTLQKEIA